MGKIMPGLIAVLAIVFFSLTGGCRTSSSGSVDDRSQTDHNLTVSAAVSLKDAFNELGALYRSRTGGTISFNFGASGALQRQIETGAPVDVFASAGEGQMNALADKNLIDAATRRDFARNTLVLIVPPDSKITLDSFTDIAKPEVEKIAVGNPKTVPAGQYTEQVFENLSLSGAVRSKLIFAEDVRQVLDYVARGEADAGIVYQSDARGAEGKVKTVMEIHEKLHDLILYPMAVVKDSKNKPAAQEFIDLVLGAEGQRILQKHGFAVGAAEK